VRITGFEWDEGNVVHLTLGHGIEPEEAEEVFAALPLYRKTTRGHYVAFGPTRAGRLLVVVFAMKGKGLARVITGWDMNNADATVLPEAPRGMKMPRRPSRVQEDLPKYYDRRGVLQEMDEQPVAFALDGELRRAILKGERVRRLQNLSIKLDATQIQALRKIATMKAIPYQTLIRQWLAEGIRKELRL
jgi:uncharacterized DUF497 family protein